MGEIHRHLSGEGRSRRAPCGRAQIVHLDIEYGGDCGLDQPPDPRTVPLPFRILPSRG
jgi:hypothetical protein